MNLLNIRHSMLLTLYVFGWWSCRRRQQQMWELAPANCRGLSETAVRFSILHANAQLSILKSGFPCEHNLWHASGHFLQLFNLPLSYVAASFQVQTCLMSDRLSVVLGRLRVCSSGEGEQGGSVASAEGLGAAALLPLLQGQPLLRLPFLAGRRHVRAARLQCLPLRGPRGARALEGC